MKTFDYLPLAQLIENQRLYPMAADQAAARRAHSVRRGAILAQARAGRGHPRNRLSVSEHVKAVRFSGFKSARASLAGNWKLSAALLGLGEGRRP